MTDGDLALTRLDEIAAASLTGEGVTRLPWTPEHRAALDIVGDWMAEAGLDVALDAAGTLTGRSPGAADRPLLLMGSHQDSVRNGGRFDGIMGIALACLAARRFRDRWSELAAGLEILAFADEEGVRYPTALIGPRALAGTLDPGVFDMTDAEGRTMRAAMQDFGLDPAAAGGLKRTGRILGYIETHIEQGPTLEREDLPVGVVTGICGISRHAIAFRGETGHAGTVPMAGRKDALVAAARLIDRVNRAAVEIAGLRATVGRIDVAPNVVNAIPGRVAVTLESRSTDDAARAAFAAAMEDEAQSIAAETGVQLTFDRSYDQPAVACDLRLRSALCQAVESTGTTALELPSGATHDASAMSDLCPVAMLFVRCRDGVSHRPEEYAGTGDMGTAIDVLEATVAAVAGDVPVREK